MFSTLVALKKLLYSNYTGFLNVRKIIKLYAWILKFIANYSGCSVEILVFINLLLLTKLKQIKV